MDADGRVLPHPTVLCTEDSPDDPGGDHRWWNSAQKVGIGACHLGFIGAMARQAWFLPSVSRNHISTIIISPGPTRAKVSDGPGDLQFVLQTYPR